ncbi:MAG: PorT family protein [Bacteroidetes bacterium]|nr:MAG: PorT family protein [Bacteroidota bacterium]
MDICSSVNKNIKVFSLGIFLLFELISSAAQAQYSGTAVARYDLNAGLNLNFTSLQHREFSDIYAKGIAPGFFLQGIKHVRPRFSFGAGLEVNQLAYSRTATDTFELFTQRIKELYVDVPLSFYFYPGRTERTWNFYAGITPSMLILKDVNKVENDLSSRSTPDPSKSGRIDFGVHVGGSIKLNSRFMVKGSYTYSLSSNQSKFYNTGRFSMINFGLGYEITKPNRKESEHELAKEQSIENYRKRNLVLLVRLKTEHKKIKAYRASGYEEDAKAIEEEVADENDLTMEAFRHEFTACPVLFFYDTLSQDIAEERYHDLFNKNKVKVDTLLNDSTDVLIAEFGSPHSDAFGASSGFGLVVYDNAFKQLTEPFPYYTSTMLGLLNRQDVIRKFNKRFTDYLMRRY